MNKVITTVVWANLLHAEFVTPEHEDTLVEVTGTYYPYRRGSYLEPHEPESAEFEAMYVLNGRTRVREFTREEYDQVDTHKVEEVLVNAAHDNPPEDY